MPKKTKKRGYTGVTPRAPDKFSQYEVKSRTPISYSKKNFSVYVRPSVIWDENNSKYIRKAPEIDQQMRKSMFTHGKGSKVLERRGTDMADNIQRTLKEKKDFEGLEDIPDGERVKLRRQRTTNRYTPFLSKAKPEKIHEAGKPPKQREFEYKTWGKHTNPIVMKVENRKRVSQGVSPRVQEGVKRRLFKKLLRRGK